MHLQTIYGNVYKLNQEINMEWTLTQNIKENKIGQIIEETDMKEIPFGLK